MERQWKWNGTAMEMEWKWNGMAEMITLGHRTKRKNRIQKHAFLLPFFWRKQKTNSVWCIPFSFFWKNKKGILNHASFFPLSEESTKGIQNDEFLFTLFEEIIQGIANHAILIPFSLSRRKHKKEFGMMNSFFLVLHKNKTGNWICLHPQGSLVPMLFLHTNGVWEWGYPPGVSNCTWLVTFDLPVYT